MTCNIRYSAAKDGDDGWQFRKRFLVKTVLSRRPDIIGFQEVWEDQFAFLRKQLKGYDHYGLFMLPGAARKDPLNVIFYKRAGFELLNASAFYLSETPHIPASRSWDNSEYNPRHANWVLLKERSSGREFRFMNTHLDHEGQIARENQARIVCENANAYPQEFPQILTGDMNCDASNAAMKIYFSNDWVDTYEAVHGTPMPGYTFHAFKGSGYEHRDRTDKDYIDKMDWILVKGAVNISGALIVTDSRDGRYSSDHYFIIADVGVVPA